MAMLHLSPMVVDNCALSIALTYFILFYYKINNTLGFFHKQFAQLLSRPKRQERGKVQPPRKQKDGNVEMTFPSF